MSMAIDIVLRSSGLGDSTVGKSPSTTACSGTSSTFLNPNFFSEAGTSRTPEPWIGV